MSDDAYKKAYEREKASRMEAEALLEDVSRELYRKNHALERANADLKKNQQTLIQQEKMASVGYLASGIAHEINNPLGYSLSNLSVLKDYFEEVLEKIDVQASDDDAFKDTLEDIPDLIA